MIRRWSITAAAAASVVLVGLPAIAENSKAPCGSFQKLPDGKWNVLKPVKIEHGKASTVVNPGNKIAPGTHVSGVDLYAALEKSCQQANSNSTTGGR